MLLSLYARKAIHTLTMCAYVFMVLSQTVSQIKASSPEDSVGDYEIKVTKPVNPSVPAGNPAEINLWFHDKNNSIVGLNTTLTSGEVPGGGDFQGTDDQNVIQFTKDYLPFSLTVNVLSGDMQLTYKEPINAEFIYNHEPLDFNVSTPGKTSFEQLTLGLLTATTNHLSLLENTVVKKISHITTSVLDVHEPAQLQGPTILKGDQVTVPRPVNAKETIDIDCQKLITTNSALTTQKALTLSVADIDNTNGIIQGSTVVFHKASANVASSSQNLDLKQGQLKADAYIKMDKGLSPQFQNVDIISPLLEGYLYTPREGQPIHGAGGLAMGPQPHLKHTVVLYDTINTILTPSTRTIRFPQQTLKGLLEFRNAEFNSRDAVSAKLRALYGTNSERQHQPRYMANLSNPYTGQGGLAFFDPYVSLLLNRFSLSTEQGHFLAHVAKFDARNQTFILALSGDIYAPGGISLGQLIENPSEITVPILPPQKAHPSHFQNVVGATDKANCSFDVKVIVDGKSHPLYTTPSGAKLLSAPKYGTDQTRLDFGNTLSLRGPLDCKATITTKGNLILRDASPKLIESGSLSIETDLILDKANVILDSKCATIDYGVLTQSIPQGGISYVPAIQHAQPTYFGQTSLQNQFNCGYMQNTYTPDRAVLLSVNYGRSSDYKCVVGDTGKITTSGQLKGHGRILKRSGNLSYAHKTQTVIVERTNESRAPYVVMPRPYERTLANAAISYTSQHNVYNPYTPGNSLIPFQQPTFTSFIQYLSYLKPIILSSATTSHIHHSGLTNSNPSWCHTVSQDLASQLGLSLHYPHNFVGGAEYDVFAQANPPLNGSYACGTVSITVPHYGAAIHIGSHAAPQVPLHNPVQTYAETTQDKPLDSREVEIDFNTRQTRSHNPQQNFIYKIQEKHWKELQERAQFEQDITPYIYVRSVHHHAQKGQQTSIHKATGQNLFTLSPRLLLKWVQDRVLCVTGKFSLFQNSKIEYTDLVQLHQNASRIADFFLQNATQGVSSRPNDLIHASKRNPYLDGFEINTPSLWYDALVNEQGETELSPVLCLPKTMHHKGAVKAENVRIVPENVNLADFFVPLSHFSAEASGKASTLMDEINETLSQTNFVNPQVDSQGSMPQGAHPQSHYPRHPFTGVKIEGENNQINNFTCLMPGDVIFKGQQKFVNAAVISFYGNVKGYSVVKRTDSQGRTTLLIHGQDKEGVREDSFTDYGFDDLDGDFTDELIQTSLTAEEVLALVSAGDIEMKSVKTHSGVLSFFFAKGNIIEEAITLASRKTETLNDGFQGQKTTETTTPIPNEHGGAGKKTFHCEGKHYGEGSTYNGKSLSFTADGGHDFRAIADTMRIHEYGIKSGYWRDVTHEKFEIIQTQKGCVFYSFDENALYFASERGSQRFEAPQFFSKAGVDIHSPEGKVLLLAAVNHYQKVETTSSESFAWNVFDHIQQKDTTYTSPQSTGDIRIKAGSVASVDV